MTDAQKITQMEESMKSLDQQMQDVMTEVYNTLDSKLKIALSCKASW